MSIVLVKQQAKENIVVQPGSVGTTVQAIPGETYNLVNQDTGLSPADVQAKRQGDDLILKSESLEVEVTIKDFWEECHVGGDQCFAKLDVLNELGELGEVVITQTGPELTYLLAGQVGTLSEVAVAAIAFPGWIAGLAGVGVAAAAAGGGSGSGAAQPSDTADTTAPDKPSVKISQDGKIVSGKAEPNSTVSIKDANGNEIGTAKADGDGNYTVTLTTPLTNGEKITADATDAAGNTSQPSATNAPDTTAPGAPTAKVADDGTSVSGKTEPNSTVTIKDENGDIIGTTKADANGDYTATLTNPQQNGQKVTVTATDAAGNPSEPTNATAPDITAPNAPSINIDQTGKTVSGKAEPNSKVSIKDANGEIGTAEADGDGNYTVTLTTPLTNGEKITADATDTAGNTSQPSATNAPDTTAPGAPTAKVADDGTSVSGKTEPNSTVTIKDENGDIIGTGKADANGDYTATLTNPQQNGQKVTVTATDAAGNPSEPTNATAPDITAPNAPSINIDQTGKTVSGKAEPNSKVSIKDANGEIGTAEADGDGNYTVTLTTPLTNGEKITADATDTAGNTSQPSATNAPDTTAPTELTAKVNQTDGKTVTGKTEAGSTVTIKDEKGNIIGTGKADANGDYTVTLTNPQQNGQTVTATATDAAGNPSKPTNAKAPDITAPDMPTGTVSNDGKTVSGNAEPNSTVKFYDKDGALIGEGKTNGSGGYGPIQLTTPQIAGDNITATAADAAGNTSKPSTVHTPDKTAPAEPTATISNDGTTVSGKAEVGSTVTIKDATGNILGTAKADADGNYSVPLSTPQTNGQKLNATATDDSGNASQPADVTAPDSSAPAAPAVAISKDGTKATGEAEPNSTVTLRDEAGKVIGTTTAGADGTYSLPLSPALTNGEKVTATATDKAGNISPEANATAPDTTAPDAPTIDKVNADGLSVVGKAEPNSTVTIKDATGNVLGTAKADADGNYNVPLNTAQTNGQTLTATATDAANNESKPATGTAPDSTAPAAPAVAISKDGTIATGEAEPNSTVTLKDEAGKVIGTTTAGADGKYEIPLSPALTNGEKVTATATDATNNTSDPAATNAPDTTAPDAPTIDKVNADGLSVVGKAEPNSTVTIKDATGNVLGTAKADADGNYNVPLNTAQTNGQTLTATATDASNNESDPTTGTAPDTTAPAAPAVAISQDGTKATGTAEPNSTVTLKDEAGKVIGTITAGADGKYEIPLSPALTNGEKVTATATDAAKNESPASNATAPDTTAPDAPNAFISDDGKTVSGTAEPNTTVTIKDKDGKPLGTAKVGEDGKYEVTLSTPQTDGQNLKATATDEAGNTSPKTDVKAPDTTPPADPTVSGSLLDNVDVVGGTPLVEGSEQPITATSNNTTNDNTPSLVIPKAVADAVTAAGDTPKLVVDGKVVDAVLSKDTAGNTVLTPKEPLAEGKHTVSYLLQDTAGNQSGAAPATTFTVDTQAPNKPAAPVDYKDDMGSVQSDNSKAPTTDDKTPGVNIGTVPAGETPTLYVDGEKVDAEITTNTDGTTTLTPKTPLGEGKHNLSYTLTDKAGNESVPSDPIAIEVDIQAPGTASVAIPETADGVNKTEAQDGVGVEVSLPSDAKTGDVVTLTVTKPDGTKEEIKHTVTDADITAKKATIAITVPTDGTADGKYTVDTVYQDAAGNPSATQPAQQSFTLDTQAPGTASVAIPEAADGVSKAEAQDGVGVAVTLPTDAKAGDVVTLTITKPDGTKEEIKHTVTDADITAKKATIAITVPTDGTADGKYTVDTVYQDAAGNPSANQPAQQSFDLTTAPPTQTVTNTNDGNVTAAEADDYDGVITVNAKSGTTSTVTFTGANGKTVTKTIINNGSDKPVKLTPAELSTLGDGAVTVSTVTKDAAGNESSPSTVGGFTLDTTPPAAGTLNAPDNSKDNTPNITGSGAEPGANVSVEIKDKDGTVVETITATVGSDGTYSVTPSKTIPDGNYTATATVTDTAGNTATTTDSGSVDTTPPNKPSITENNAGDVVVKPSDIAGDDTTAIKINYTDENGASKTIEVAKGDDGKWAAKDGTTLPAGAAVNATTGEVKIPTNLINTRQEVTATAADAAGNTADTTQTGDTTPPNAPTVEGDTAGKVTVKPSTVTGDDTTAIKVEYTDEKGNAKTIEVVKGDNGTWAAKDGTSLPSITEGGITKTATVDPSTGTVAIPTELVNTSKDVTATAADSAGNTAPATLAGDITPPATPTINVVASNDVIDANEAKNDITLTGDAEAGSKVEVKDATGNIIGTATADENGKWTMPLTPDQVNTMKQGADSLTVTATDAAGNSSSSAPRAIEVDTVVPDSLTVTITTDGNNDDTITSTGTGAGEMALTDTTIAVEVTFDKNKAQAGDTIVVKDNANNEQTITLSEAQATAGKVTTTFPKPMEGEKLEVSATYTDTAGNTVANSNIVTDSAILNLLPPGTPTVQISTDADNNGYINATENNNTGSGKASVTVTLAFPTSSDTFQAPQVGDTLTIYAADGTTQLGSKVLEVGDITAKKVVFNDVAGLKLTNGQILTVKAKLVDNTNTADAGWQADTPGTDIATVDLTAPTQTVANTNDGNVTAAEANGANGVITVNSEAGSTSTVTFTGANGGTVTKTVNNTDSAIPVKLTATELATLGDGEVTVSTVTKDKAGNTSAPNTTGGFTLDTKAPTATITLSDAELKKGETSTVTIQFSEEVKDFALADLTAQNGELTNLVQDATDKTKYTATFTPTADIESASNTITLANTYTDLAGNVGTATSAAYKVDTKAPTATIVMEDTSLIAGETSKVTIIFSEKVKDFNSADDVTVENGTLSAMTSNDGGTTWVGTFTPTANIESASNTITLKDKSYTDLAGNVGDTASTTYAVDTKVPTGVVTSVDIVLDSQNAAGEVVAGGDGYINKAEKGNATTTNVKVGINANVAVDDVVGLDTTGDGIYDKKITVETSHINAKAVTFTGVALTEGEKINVKAAVIGDKAGNTVTNPTVLTDAATVDTTAPTGVVTKVEIMLDTKDSMGAVKDGGDGIINAAEKGTASKTGVKVSFDTSVQVGDVIRFDIDADGNGVYESQKNHTVTQADIDNGKTVIFTDVAAVTEGGTINVKAAITADKAGNTVATPTEVTDTVKIDTIAPTIAKDAIVEDKQLLAKGVVFDTEKDNTIGYFEKAASGTKLGKIAAVDDADPSSETEYNSGIKSYEWDTTGKGTDAQRSWYEIDANGNISLTAAGASSAMNDYETGDNKVTLTVKITDNAGNTSTRDITFELGNTMGLAKIQDHLSDTETIHKNTGVKVTASDSNAVGFTTELADKVWVGKNEDGTPATETGLGSLGEISNWNLGEPGRLFTKGGSDFISFVSMAQYAGVYAGKGNDTIAVQKSFSGISDGNGPIIMAEEGNDFISIGENLDGGFLLAGSGSDTIQINGSVKDKATIDLGSAVPKDASGAVLAQYKTYVEKNFGTDTGGDLTTDKNTVIINGDFAGGSRIIGYIGEDSVTIKGGLNNSSLIDLGAGNDTLILEGALGKGIGTPTVKMGDGDDTLIYKGSQTNIDSFEITLLDGGLGANDVLDFSQPLDGKGGTGYIEYGLIKGFETIKLGSSYQGGLRISGEDLKNDEVATLKIDGTANSKVDLQGNFSDWTKSATADADGYYTYTYTNNESVLIHKNIAEASGGVF